MKLLPKKENKRPVVEVVERKTQIVEGIRTEINKLNSIRDATKQETSKITGDSLRIIGELELKWRELQFEVENLQNLRSEALKPFNDKWILLDERNKELVLQSQSLQQQRTEVENEKTKLDQERLAVNRTKKDLENRESLIVPEENSLKVEKARIKESSDTLNLKWKEYYEQFKEIAEKTLALGEIGDLEVRKSKALEPLNKIKENLELEQLRLDESKSELHAKEQEILDRKKSLEKEKVEIDSKWIELSEREIKIQSVEGLVRVQRETLEKDLVAFEEKQKQFDSEIEAKKKALEAEVLLLEARRKEALQPLAVKVEELKAVELGHIEREKQLTKNVEINNLFKQELEEEKKSLETRGKEIEKGEVQLRNSRTTLARQLRNFEKNMGERKSAFDKKQFLFSLKEKEQENGLVEIEAEKEANLKVKKSLDEYKLSLEKERKHIESQQAALRAALKLRK